MVESLNGINFQNFSDGASVQITGTTANTKLLSVLIPANTFKLGDLIRLESMFSKTGTAGTYTLRFYWNTSNTLTGAIQLSIRGISSTRNFAVHSRRLSVRNASGGGLPPLAGTEILTTTSGAFNEYRSWTVSNASLNWTVNSYLMCACQLGNSGDSVTNNYFKVWTH